MTDPKPILVLGVNRSGTKWLCNEISRHPSVASVAHDLHGGIVESNLLSDYGRTFEFRNDESYRAFLDFWAQTHFFLLAGGNVADFDQPLGRRPEGPVEALARLMGAYATRKEATYWVQKVPPTSTEYVLDRLPAARLVMIERNLEDTVRSRVKLDRKRGMGTSAFRAALSISVQNKELGVICRQRDVFRVSYERLKARRVETMSAVFQFLGLSPVEAEEGGFPQNTSFAADHERATIISKTDLLAIRFAKFAVRLTPLWLLRLLRGRLTKADASILPGTFRHLATEGSRLEYPFDV